MTHTTAFHPEHILAMDIQPHQAWMRELVSSSNYGKLMGAGVAETLWDGDTPIACYGESLLWDGNGEVWSVFARTIGHRMMSVRRATLGLIDRVTTRRLQAYIDVEFAPGVRWMLNLGFKVEGKAVGYFPNGNDAFIFALIRGADVQPFALVKHDGEPMLDKILRLEREMRALPQVTIEPVHHFSNGVYAREITIKKGTLLTGKMHATAHLNIISKGDISVLTDEGVRRIKAPATIFSKAGIKRVGYAHEDTVWTTIHGTFETDLEKLEAELIIPPARLMSEVES